MPTSVAIDPHAVLALADLASAAADRADELRTSLLRWFDAAWLDGAPPAGLLARADDGLVLLAAVLRSRATQAAYPLDDLVGLTLNDDVRRAETGLRTYLGPDATRVADGRRVAQEVRASDDPARDELVARILAGSDDPSFALGFTTELGIDGAGVAVLRSSYVHPDARSMGTATAPQRDAWAVRHRALLAALGHAYATASHGSGAFAGPAGDAAAWTAAVTAEGADALYAAQGAAVAVLATYGDLDPDVLADVVEGVYRYERTTAADGAPLWLPRSQSYDTYLGARTPEGLHAYDPLATLLGALGRQPRAAQTFFARAEQATRTVGGGDRPLNARLLYLFEARRWPTDGGAGFGAALDAATTVLRDRDTAGMRAASLASQAIAIVALVTGDGAGGWGIFHRDGWSAPEGTRHSLAHIVAGYLPDVFTAIRAGATLPPGAPWYSQDPPGFPAGGPYGLTTTTAMLATVVETIGTDPAAAELLLAAVLATGQLRLRTAARELAADNPTLAADLLTDVGGGGDRRTLAPLANAASQGADALGFVVQHAYVGASGDQARALAAQRRWMALLDVAIALPTAPLPAGPWGKLAVSQATDALFGAWQRRVPDDATAAYRAIDRGIEVRMEQLVLNTLAAEGLLHPAQPIVGYEPPPDAAFVRSATTGRPIVPMQLDVDSQAYRDWAVVYRPTAWVDTNLALPYLKAFDRIG